MRSAVRDSLERFRTWSLHSEGSTRPAGLIRIGLALLIWSRWAAEVSPFYRPQAMRLVIAPIFLLVTTLMLVGLWTRLSTFATTVVIGAMYAYGVAFPERSKWDTHHTYLLVFATLLCILMPAGKSFSIDRWLAVRRARSLGLPPPPERGNLWAQRLITIQVALVYFWAAVDKTHPGYFNGARMEQVLMRIYFGSEYPSWRSIFHLVCLVFGVMTVLTEYALAFGLFFRRLRPWFMLLGLIFHAVLYMALPIATFSATMILLYLAYLDPDRVHQTIDDVMGIPAVKAQSAPAPASRLPS